MASVIVILTCSISVVAPLSSRTLKKKSRSGWIVLLALGAERSPGRRLPQTALRQHVSTEETIETTGSPEGPRPESS